MKLSHPTADGIERPARSLPRGLRVAVLLAVVVAAGLGAQGALAADPTVTLSLSASAIPDGGSVTMTATVTGTAAIPTGSVNFIDAASPGVPIGSVLLSPGGSHSVVARLTTSALRTKATPYSIYAEYVPDTLAFLGGLNTVQSAPQSLLVGTVIPTPHPTQVILSAPTDVVSTTPVTLTATVSELPPGTGTPTGKVQFVDMESGVPTLLTASDGTSDFTLDSHGTAQLVLTLQEGPHQLVATYNGNAIDASSSSPPVYVTSHAPADVTVTTDTTVVVSPQQIVAGDLVTITATVVQTGPGAPAQPTGPVTFSGNSIYGNNVFIATAALGSAPAGLTAAPNQAIIQTRTFLPADYTIVASYFGDLYDKASGGHALLSVSSATAATVIRYTGATTAVFGHSALLSATVTDRSGSPLVGRLVTFTVGSQVCTATSDAAGHASCSLVVTTGAGLTPVTADVAPDAATEAAHTAAGFTVTPAPTSISPGVLLGAGSTTLTATLLTDTGTPLPSQPVTLTFGPNACSATTDATGFASCPVQSIVGQPTATLSASFAGNLDYQPSTASTVVHLSIPTALTYTGATSGDYNDPATLSARLLDAAGAPVAGMTVNLALGSQTCPAVTGSTGVAACTLTVSLPAGAYAVSVTFAGSGLYLPSTATSPFTVTREQTTVAALTAGPVLRGSLVTLTGKLLEDGVTPVGGKTLTLGLGALTCATGPTDAGGTASCTIPGTMPLGAAVTTAGFSGDTFYLPAASTSSALLYALAPGGGTFAVGDGSAAGSVTFWGAQWAKLNRVSGGSAPDAFKGYAAGGPVQCGKAWSTAPGNSSAPPDAPLPAYMAVLVTGSVTKTGATISGTTVHVVIVRTDPGYRNDPGHAGTGVVVATVC